MFKQGQVIILEQGSFSDFGYAGPFRILVDFTKEAAVAAFRASTAEHKQDEQAFVAWLAREHYIKDIESEHWYLGDYSFDPLDFVPDEGRPQEDDRPLDTRCYTRTPEAQERYESGRIENQRQLDEERAKPKPAPEPSILMSADEIATLDFAE